MKYQSSRQLTLLEALGEISPESSKTTLRSWLKDERVTVDNAVIKLAHFPVKTGQQIEVHPKKRLIEGNIAIIYEDPHFVVIDKPYGMLSVAAAFETEKTVHAFLKSKYHPRKVFVVHRLDQETSGVMLFALSQEGYEKLKIIFEKHDLERSYTAIVEGALPESSGTWRSYLFEDDNYLVHSTQDPNKGRLCITHFQVVKTSKYYTWASFTLETGRKNQIRAHCQDAGCPVIGDKKYGASSNPIKRLGLHARLLAFEHPITHKKLSFESPVPQIFYKLFPH